MGGCLLYVNQSSNLPYSVQLARKSSPFDVVLGKTSSGISFLNLFHMHSTSIFSFQGVLFIAALIKARVSFDYSSSL